MEGRKSITKRRGPRSYQLSHDTFPLQSEFEDISSHFPPLSKEKQSRSERNKAGNRIRKPIGGDASITVMFRPTSILSKERDADNTGQQLYTETDVSHSCGVAEKTSTTLCDGAPVRPASDNRQCVSLQLQSGTEEGAPQVLRKTDATDTHERADQPSSTLSSEGASNRFQSYRPFPWTRKGYSVYGNTGDCRNMKILPSQRAPRPENQQTSMPDEEVNFEFPEHMNFAVRLINDNMEITDFLQRYLSDKNTNYIVVGAIGVEGCGKSTLLSMLSGNSSKDFYRHYTFRPASQELIEDCKYQTMKIDVYVTRDRMILLDCQALFSAEILHDVIRNRSMLVPKLIEICKSKIEIGVEVESLILTSFLLQVCHCVLLCSEWFIDIDIIRHIRVAEMFRSKFTGLKINDAQVTPKTGRRANFAFVLHRAKPEDFMPTTVAYRAKLLETLFSDSSLNVLGGLNSVNKCHSFECTEANYVALSEYTHHKWRQESDYNHDQQAGTAIRYDKAIKALRNRLWILPRDNFIMEDRILTEKEWFTFAKAVWRYAWVSRDLSEYVSFLLSS